MMTTSIIKHWINSFLDMVMNILLSPNILIPVSNVPTDKLTLAKYYSICNPCLQINYLVLSYVMINKCIKVTFDTRKKALADIKLQNASRIRFNKRWHTTKKSTQKLRVYECVYCGKYHITTQKKHKW